MQATLDRYVHSATTGPVTTSSNGDATVALRYESRLHHVGLGRAHKGRSVLVLVADRGVRVIDANG